MSPVEAASGIYRIANSHMSDLIRKATVERGYDPRNFTLFAFGGAAPMHAGRYAADLGIKQVVVPLTASVHGATGLISSDVVYEYGKSDHVLVPAPLDRIQANFSGLLERAYADLRAAGFEDRDIRIQRSVDMRYRYQVHELNVPFPAGAAEITEKDMENLYAHFDELYEKAYGAGSGYAEAGREILTFRVIAGGALRKPQIKEYPLEKISLEEARKGKRDVYFEEERDFIPTSIYDFDRIKPGMEIPGPGIIETPVTTIVVNPKDRAVMDGFRNVKILVGAG
jgi:N-methylhydantoinase A